MFEDTETSKAYVGTTVDVRNRLLDHIRDAENKDYHFYRSVRKHGWDRFEFYVLESGLTQRRGLFLEVKWISVLDSFKNGYNSTLGGSGFSTGEYHAQVRKIKAIDFDTNEEFHFDWCGGASEYLGVSKANIGHVLSDKNNNYVAYNLDKTKRFIFRYEEDEIPSIDSTITPWEVPIPIVMRNIDTKELLFFRSIVAAGEYINTTTENISSVLRRESQQVYSKITGDRYEARYDPLGCDWSDDITRKEDLKNIAIVAYKDGNLFKRYKSTIQAATELGILRTSITNCLRKESRSASGYVFCI